MKYILSFCASCGVLLPAGVGTREEPSCDNCGSSIKDKEDRIEGEFEEEDAKKLLDLR